MGVIYSLARADDGSFLLKAHRVARFEDSADLRSVSAWSDEKYGTDMVGILASGLLVSVLLTLRRALVLHASAVEIDGSVLTWGPPFDITVMEHLLKGLGLIPGG
jgi:hypothetical protein